MYDTYTRVARTCWRYKSAKGEGDVILIPLYLIRWWRQYCHLDKIGRHSETALSKNAPIQVGPVKPTHGCVMGEPQRPCVDGRMCCVNVRP